MKLSDFEKVSSLSARLTNLKVKLKSIVSEGICVVVSPEKCHGEIMSGTYQPKSDFHSLVIKAMFEQIQEIKTELEKLGVITSE